MGDLINHPSHYNQGGLEVIDVIENWDLGFHLGNAIKYIARCRFKGDVVGYIRKAIWYLQRYIGDNVPDSQKKT